MKFDIKCLFFLLLLLCSTSSLAVDFSGITLEEKESIEMVCMDKKVLEGPAAYRICINHQLEILSKGVRRPNLEHLTADERQSIEMVCMQQKVLEGPASYNQCLKKQLSLLTRGSRQPSLAGLDQDDRQSIEFVCMQDKILNGPAAYNECLRNQLALLNQPIREVDPRRKSFTPPSNYSDVPYASHQPKRIETLTFEWPDWHGGVPTRKPSPNSEKLRLTDLYQKVSPSVYAVLAAPTKDSLLNGDIKQGSAVAVSKKNLLTNCHVLEDSSFIAIIQQKKYLQAKLIRADPETDRCVLQAAESSLIPIAGVRLWSTLKIGERVYSIGTPSGLEQTLGEGIISGLREYKGVNSIQTTAQISPGSSGGGLFDDKGNLIGITTFLLKESQALNFALTAEAFWN